MITMGGTQADYALEQDRLKRKRAIADAMMAQSMQPMGGTETVGGIAVRRSPLEGLAKVAQAYMAMKSGQGVDDEARALSARHNADIASAIGDYTRATTPRPESWASEGIDERYQPAVTPTDTDRQSAAVTLAGRIGNPADVGKLLVAEALKPRALKNVDLGDAVGMVDDKGNVVQRLPKAATPDARMRADTTMQTHVSPSGSALLGANVSMRGQDLTDTRAREEGSANRGVTVRGQDLISETTRRGQDLTDTRTRTEGALNRGVTTRGQDMTDIRQREALDQGRVTDTQRMAAGYADRMLAAEDTLAKLTTGKDAISGKPGGVEAALATLPLVGKLASNVARSEPRQQYRQAQEDWVRAKLRKESGAVIADEEMDREIRTYFPQMGDDPGVIAQKEQARRLAAEGMVNAGANAPRAYTGPERRQSASGLTPAEQAELEELRRRWGR